MDDFSFALKDKLNHNKQVEIKLAQLVAALPFSTNSGKVQAITTRGGGSTRDPPYPQCATRRQAAPKAPASPEEKNDDEVEELESSVPEMMQDFNDSNIMPFP